jgi:sigma-B regulation protein RsbU (phosphoserine phosphatase)
MLVTGLRVERLETGGMVLGLFDGTPFKEGRAVLEPGDFLVTFSDGVSEAMDREGEEFGDERLLERIATMTESEGAPRLKHIFATVSAFTAGAAQNDDVTGMVSSAIGVRR